LEQILLLYNRPSSEIVKEMEIEKGGYVCHNCHYVIHEDVSRAKKIYDENIFDNVLNDNQTTKRNFEQNLIHYNQSIKDILVPENSDFKSFLEYLTALFEISEKKTIMNEEEGVSRQELKRYLEQKSSVWQDVFENRELSKKYIRIVEGARNGKPPTKYYINDEGRRIVRLIYYFRDYYKNFKERL